MLFQAEEKDDNIVKSNLCKIDGNNLKYNSNPKLLGITLDEELNFQEHVNMTEKKASRALQIIREVKGISQISTKKLIELYACDPCPFYNGVWMFSVANCDTS